MKMILNVILALIFATPIMVNAAESGGVKEISQEQFQTILSACDGKAEGAACSVNGSTGKCASQIRPDTKAKELICKI